MLDPLIVSWGWQARTPGASPSQDYFEWIGTDDPSAYLSVPAAIEFQERYDWAQVRLAAHRLASDAPPRLAELRESPPRR